MLPLSHTKTTALVTTAAAATVVSIRTTARLAHLDAKTTIPNSVMRSINDYMHTHVRLLVCQSTAGRLPVRALERSCRELLHNKMAAN